MINGSNIHEWPSNYRKVLHYFFSFPEQAISLNNLARNTKISKTSAKSAVIYLFKENFLKKEVVGNAWRLFADQKSPLFVTKKIPYNLELVYGSGIIAQVYKKIPEARTIVLFGSYRWGTDTEESDIDIGVEILGNREMQIENLMLLKNIGLRKDIKVNLHIFTRNKINLNLFTNIANGIVLDGLIEVHP